MPGGHIGVGIFFAITGYFLVSASKINYKKTFITVRFYALLLSIVALICLLCGYSFPGLSIYGVLSSVFLCLTVPAFGNIWWFITAYVILLFLAPAINNLMKPDGNNMADNQINTIRGGGILLLVWILGYGISWFPGTGICNLWRAVFFYMIGAYIRIGQSKISFLESKYVSSITLVVLWILSSLFMTYSYTNVFDPDSKIKILSSVSLAFNEVFVIPVFVYIIFNEFLQKNIPYKEKINKVSSTVFGIYIIHECPFMRPIIWQSLLGMSDIQYHSTWYPFTALLSIATVFLVGMIVDLLRQKYAERIMNNWTDKVVLKFSIR